MSGAKRNRSLYENNILQTVLHMSDFKILFVSVCVFFLFCVEIHSPPTLLIESLIRCGKVSQPAVAGSSNEKTRQERAKIPL